MKYWKASSSKYVRPAASDHHLQIVFLQRSCANIQTHKALRILRIAKYMKNIIVVFIIIIIHSLLYHTAGYRSLLSGMNGNYALRGMSLLSKLSSISLTI